MLPTFTASSTVPCVPFREVERPKTASVVIWNTFAPVRFGLERMNCSDHQVNRLIKLGKTRSKR